jgi:hypothetical protein
MVKNMGHRAGRQNITEILSRTGRLNPPEVLRTLPQNEAFYFFEDLNKYTGKSASNLAEFCDMTKTVDKKSIIFHFKRRDFEKWIKETLRDKQLAKRIRNIKKTKSEKRLRTQIYKVSKKRLEELNKKAS